MQNIYTYNLNQNQNCWKIIRVRLNAGIYKYYTHITTKIDALLSLVLIKEHFDFTVSPHAL